MDLIGKKTKLSLGSMMNEAAATKPSEWAKKLLEKQGWAEGKGLGRKEDGMTTHIKAKKKDDTNALGYVAVKAAVGVDLWYDSLNVFSNNKGTAIGGRAAVKLDDSDSDESDEDEHAAKSSKRRKRARSSSDGGEEPASEAKDVYAELFAATGGARLGMRARADQGGKWARAETGVGARSSETLGKQQKEWEEHASAAAPSHGIPGAGLGPEADAAGRERKDKKKRKDKDRGMEDKVVAEDESDRKEKKDKKERKEKKAKKEKHRRSEESE